MEIYEVNNRFFRSYDLAVIERSNTFRKIKVHRLNEDEHLEVYRENDKVFVKNEDKQEVIVTFDVDIHNTLLGSDEYSEHVSSNVRIRGVDIYTLGLSKVAERTITNEVDNVSEHLNNLLWNH